MSTCIDFDDGDEQPLSLEEWQARCIAEIAAMRAAAHAQIDAHFDAHLQRLAIEMSCVERTMAGVVLN